MAKRPTWDEYFLKFAQLAATRSHDSQTKVGCVITADNKVLGVGYNGFCTGVEEKNLPTTRPEKYPFMIHAEANAIYNAAKNGVSTIDSTCYVTAVPCLACLQMLNQCGIREVVFSDISSPKMEIYSNKYDTILELIKDRVSLRYIPSHALDTDTLECILENFKKNQEPS